MTKRYPNRHLHLISFKDGFTCTTYLDTDICVDRMKNLDNLRVLVEGYDAGEGKRIYEKAVAAYNKRDHFTGIIRLSTTEKDFLGYILAENDCITDQDRDTLKRYIRRGF